MNSFVSVSYRKPQSGNDRGIGSCDSASHRVRRRVPVVLGEAVQYLCSGRHTAAFEHVLVAGGNKRARHWREETTDFQQACLQVLHLHHRAMKTEPQMETVITTIATTNAQTSLLRLSDSSANRVSTAANRVDRRELDLRKLLGELFAELRELDIHLGVEFDESGLCLDLKVCQVTFRGELLPSSRWLLYHKELRFLLTYRVGKTAVDLGSLLLCQGHYGLPSNS